MTNETAKAIHTAALKLAKWIGNSEAVAKDIAQNTVLEYLKEAVKEDWWAYRKYGWRGEWREHFKYHYLEARRLTIGRKKNCFTHAVRVGDPLGYHENLSAEAEREFWTESEMAEHGDYVSEMSVEPKRNAKGFGYKKQLAIKYPRIG